MTVTERLINMGDTSSVNMVRRACTNALFEPGDTEWPWKGEAAASFVCTGITSSRVLPTSSAGYWSPIILCNARASEETSSFGAFFLCQFRKYLRSHYDFRYFIPQNCRSF
jgi:hypothetical protein